MSATITVQRVDRLERLSRLLTLMIAGVTILSAFAAPLLALRWSDQPFPGFLVEQTLVVNDISGHGWTGHLQGIDYPQQVTRVGGFAIASSDQYQAALARLNIGEQASFFTHSPEGDISLYPSVTLTPFPTRSLVRLFWMPYLVGVAYLAIGAWIYRVKGKSRPGRALAFFCYAAALTCILFFDAASSHAAPGLWVASFAMLGGALISLSLRFPQESVQIELRPWLLAVPYGIALVLAGWAIAAMNSLNPWAYIPTRYAIYVYTVLGVFGFIGTMFYRARSGDTPTTRRQARIVLLGSALAFGPITLWFIATVLSPTFQFDIALLLPPLILFPLSVALAIFRYRLLEVDSIVNRTILYGLVTAILAGVTSVAVGLVQRFFINTTGEKNNELATVITALIVVSTFEPIKAWVRGLVDRTLKEPPDTTTQLRSFGEEVQVFLTISSAEQVAQRLLEETARGLRAPSGALSMMVNGKLTPSYTVGNWRGEAWMAVPLEWRGQRFGMIALGPRPDEPYTRHECDLLEEVATQVAGAVMLAHTFHQGGAGINPANRPLATLVNDPHL